MNEKKKKRIGLIGFGQIGSFLYQEITSHPEFGLEIAFVHEVVKERTDSLPKQIILDRMEDFGKIGVDLVAEVAHPDAVRKYGSLVLKQTDFFMLSVMAMADASLEQNLRQIAREKNHKIYIAHGATVGLDGMGSGTEGKPGRR